MCLKMPYPCMFKHIAFSTCCYFYIFIKSTNNSGTHYSKFLYEVIDLDEISLCVTSEFGVNLIVAVLVQPTPLGMMFV